LHSIGRAIELFHDFTEPVNGVV